MEGEEKMKKDKDYDLVQDYVLTFRCPPEFKGFVINDAIFLRRRSILEYGLEEHFPKLEF
jgi:hypothetical protein